MFYILGFLGIIRKSIIGPTTRQNLLCIETRSVDLIYLKLNQTFFWFLDRQNMKVRDSQNNS